MENLNLETLCKKVTEIAREAGAFIESECRTFSLDKIEHKGARDLVSYVDKEAEKKIVKGLKQILPEAGFVTEEGTMEKTDNALKWVIDPLDGTTNFLHKLPTYSVSIALMDKEDYLLGVVYEPNLKECFYAWRNGGAYCNGSKITVSKINKLDDSLIATGFPYSLLDKTDNYFAIIRNFVEKTHGLRRLGSAAVDLCYVACGRFEGYFEFNLKIWDIAAGILIVKEAGGTVSDYSGGNDYIYGQELLATGNIQKPMMEIIQQHWNK
jgi:myo-inositol-1(or 4)-monophosphatase